MKRDFKQPRDNVWDDSRTKKSGGWTEPEMKNDDFERWHTGLGKDLLPAVQLKGIPLRTTTPSHWLFDDWIYI